MTTVADQAEVLRDVLGRPGRSRQMVDERLRAFDRLPFLTDELRESHIQLLPEDPVPEDPAPPDPIPRATVQRVKGARSS